MSFVCQKAGSERRGMVCQGVEGDKKKPTKDWQPSRRWTLRRCPLHALNCVRSKQQQPLAPRDDPLGFL